MDQAVEQPRLVRIEPPSVKEAWEMVLSQLRMEMPAGAYASWVEPLKPVSFKEGVFRVGAANGYAREWVETRLRSRITGLLEGVLNQKLQVNFAVLKGGELPLAESPAPADAATAEVETAETAGDAVADIAPEAREANGRKRKSAASKDGESASPRKIQLQRAYGTERARVIQPERGMFITMYFFNHWLPMLGHSAMTTVIAARSMCYWNPMTGEMRNTVETDMSEIAKRAAVSVRTVKDVLNNDLVKQYFLRYKVRRVMTPNGVRTAGIILQVRMDDPLTPEDQDANNLHEEAHWYTLDFEDED